jgi:hypothetical protein
MTRWIVAAVIVFLLVGMVAVSLSQSSAAGYLSRGIAHFDKGEYDAALRDYDMALRLKPNLAEA